MIIRAFAAIKKMKKSTVRTIFRITVEQDAGSGLVKLEFEGNGFLQNMVRILTGTLIEVGLGKRDAGSMPANPCGIWTVRRPDTRHRQKDSACSRYFINKMFL